MMAPYLLLFIFFIVLPVIVAAGMSFSYYNIIKMPRFIGWSNYQQLFLEDDVFLIALKNTLLFALITGPVSYFMCLMFAWLVNELRPKVRAVSTLLFYAPSISGNVIFIWQYIFSDDAYGLINGLMMRLGLFKEPFEFLKEASATLPVLMIVQLWMSLGTSFLAFIAGLQCVDKALYESGAIDGIKNRFQELYYITLPSMKPQLMFGAVMQISATFAVGGISRDLIGFPSPLYSAHTVVLHMEDYGAMRYEMGYASTIAVVLFLMTMLVNLAVQRALKE